MKHLIILVACFPILACSLAPATQLPTQRTGDAWKGSAPAGEMALNGWDDFGSAALPALITQALAANTDLAITLARVEQARATARIAGSGLYPQVNASGSADQTRADQTTEQASAGLSVAYEVDLWQRNRNSLESALFSLDASAGDRDAQALLVASEVARLYTGILAYDARIAVAQKNLANAREVLRITEARHNAGSISGLELAQQRTSVANTEASIASIQNQRALFVNALAQLMGLAPAALMLPQESFAQLHPGAMALGTPWQMLQRRPDIAAAEARLRAANIDIGIARADALPSLSLALNAQVLANPASGVASLAASFFAPIFQGGALQGAIDQREAVRDERIASYEGVLLNALREVEDALATVEATNARRNALATAAEEARTAERIARARFNAGSIDFTTLLATQATLLQTEDSYYAAGQEQLAAHIDLMRALGGPPSLTAAPAKALN